MSTNSDLVNGLRALADFVESNDDINFATGDSEQLKLDVRTWYMWGKSPDEKKAFVAEIARRLGKCEKRWVGDFFYISKAFGPCVKFEATTERETICERVVTGKRVIPAQPEHLVPAVPETEVEEVEWRCHPLLETNSAA